jgi:hypothetical protein
MTLHRLSLIACLAACSSSSATGDDLPDCPTGNCGQPSFRRAVPTRAKVRIERPTGTSRKQKLAPPVIGHGRAVALEAVSPALLVVDERVVMIDTVVDELFTELEASATATPELETAGEHVWRAADPGLAGRDDVLRITTTDDVHFQITYFIVPHGGAAAGAPIVHGEVRLANDADVLDFELTIDFDAYTAVDPTAASGGDMVLAAMPFSGGTEHWFDFHDVWTGNGPVANTRTTAWTFADDSGALEYVADVEGAPATVYARWDERGGRYDHHTQYVEANLGPVDEIVTNCWDATGGEDFDAWAVIDAQRNYYGEIDGTETACAFGPVADHPDPGSEFDDLPRAGEWQLLELLSWCYATGEC